MNSDRIQRILRSEFLYEFIYEFRIHSFEFMYRILILMNWYIHFIYQFRCIWVHIIISYMNSYNDYMNSHVYVSIYMNLYMNSCNLWIHNSCKLWIHMIFSFMNSNVSWIHIWIQGVPRFQMQVWPSHPNLSRDMQVYTPDPILSRVIPIYVFYTGISRVILACPGCLFQMLAQIL